jgi:hypothetical protein
MYLKDHGILSARLVSMWLHYPPLYFNPVACSEPELLGRAYYPSLHYLGV